MKWIKVRRVSAWVVAAAMLTAFAGRAMAVDPTSAEIAGFFTTAFYAALIVVLPIVGTLLMVWFVFHKVKSAALRNRA